MMSSRCSRRSETDGVRRDGVEVVLVGFDHLKMDTFEQFKVHLRIIVRQFIEQPEIEKVDVRIPIVHMIYLQQILALETKDDH